MSQPQTYEVTANVKAAAASPQPAGEGLGNLVLRLAEEMATAWQQGERPTVEDLLERYPELKSQPDGALPLLCEEICLREEYGQCDAEAIVLDRFASWRGSVEPFLIQHRRQREGRPGPGFPSSGEFWADFHLLTELGRGALGRVFLATQPALANRAVVLKISTRDAREHLSLARLQHTHIVPLYAVQEDTRRNLRALCMPYFGGAALGQVLEVLEAKPPAQRTGQDVLDALDQFQARSPIAMPTKGPARTLLSKATYPQAVCILGACLAEALKYAHERSLIHLDIKPANVLLAADGQPMLLDFHLAREPLQAGAALPEWFGGTPAYMSPEQRQVTAAVRTRQHSFPAVDGRSDLYSLGLVLYEMLAGERPRTQGGPLPRLETRNAQLTTGLADIVHKCLAADADQRYADAGALAADLNRYLSNRPLVGVRNRNLLECWRKWTRREPNKLARLGTICGILIALLMGVNQVRGLQQQQRTSAEEALSTAQQQLQRQQYSEALQTLAQGLHTAQGLWWGGEDLHHRLRDQSQRTLRAQAAHSLHTLMERVRFQFGAGVLREHEMQSLEESCRKVWEARSHIAGRLAGGMSSAHDLAVQTDLLDLALLWTDLRLNLVPEAGKTAVRREVLQTLDEAESLFGPSVVLDQIRRYQAQALGLPVSAPTDGRAARTEWDYFALGRALLNAGDVEAAAAPLARAVALRPDSFWPSFCAGTCAFHQGRYEDAVRAFHACVALRPQSPECSYNRGLAHRELGETEAALADFSRALELDPRLARAALNRGILLLELDRVDEAKSDLQRALSLGSGPVEVHYHLAWAYHKKGHWLQALEQVNEVLRRAPGHKDAQALQETLKQQNPRR